MATHKLSCALALALLSTGARAAGDFDYDIYAGILHSNNITLVSQQPISQGALVPGTDFTWKQQGADLKANVTGSLEYRDYPGSDFKSQTATQLSGQALWTLSPQRLDFSVQDYAGLEPLDTLANDRPDNRQQTNVFMAGPILHFLLGEATHGQAELRYINSYASKTDNFNSNRGQAALRVIRDISPTSQFSLNVDAQKVDLYHDDLDSNYNRYEAFGHYVKKLPRLALDLEAGVSRVTYAQAGLSSHTSPMFRASAMMVLNAENSMTLNSRRQYSDAVQDLTLRPGTDPLSNDYGIGTGNTMVNPQVFLETKSELVYNYHTERLTVSLAPYYHKLAYLGDMHYDQRGRGLDSSIDYRLQPTMTLQAFASRENLHYNAIGRRDRLLNAGIGLTDQRTHHWGWRAALTRTYRHSTIVQQSYNETLVYVGVIYKR